MRTACLLAIVSLAGNLLGCGQKGPLVLPNAQHPHKKIGVSKPPAAPAPTPATPAGPMPTPGPAPIPAGPASQP